MPADAPQYTEDRIDSLEFTSVRIHELALQRWLHKAFPIGNSGYPTPVIFSTPRDAHSEFSKLWNSNDNPFEYLTKIRDADGKLVYPRPSNVIYPLINVTRLNWRFRPSQNVSIHRDRRLYWPTSGTNITLDDLGWAASNNRPAAWDFRFQIDYYCKTPFTLSTFVNRLQRKLSHGGGTPQTFVLARYPFPHGPQFIRTYLESDIDNSTTQGDQDSPQEMRVTFTLAMEGWAVDYFTIFTTVAWYTALGQEKTPVPPEILDQFFDFNDIYPGAEDIRIDQHNPAINTRSGLPPKSSA